MKRLFDGQTQHFHKSRQDRMLLPHRELSGLLFTINPRQEERARREIIQFLEPIIADIKREYELVGVKSKDKGLPLRIEEKVEETVYYSNNNNNSKSTLEFSANAQSECNSSAYKSTSSLLALELNEVMSDNYKICKNSTHNLAMQNCKRPRTHTMNDGVDDNDDDCNYEANNNCNDNSSKDVIEERSINNNTRDNRNDKELHESSQHCKSKESWLHIRETNCKGYLFVQIPVIDREKSCVVCNHTLDIERKGNCKKSDNNCGKGNECICTSSINKDDNHTNSLKEEENLVAHSIVINPLVAITVERLFDDLTANPRPVFRSCFRLYPVELCCCPTLSEMQTALRTLLNMHFPSKNSSSNNVLNTNTYSSDGNCLPLTSVEMKDDIIHNEDDTSDNSNLVKDDSNNLTVTHEIKCTNGHELSQKVLYLPSLPSNSKYAHKSLHTIALHVNVKNNTKVEQQKSWLTSQLLQCIPANQFILVSPQHINQKKTSLSSLLVEVVITINILHSTCCIGVQSDFENRHKYNVHDIASSSLQLQSESTFTSRVHEQHHQQEEEELLEH